MVYAPMVYARGALSHGPMVLHHVQSISCSRGMRVTLTLALALTLTLTLTLSRRVHMVAMSSSLPSSAVRAAKVLRTSTWSGLGLESSGQGQAWG